MDLLTYISDIPRREKLAASVKRNPLYLWQIATGWRGKRASPALAQSIESETTRLGPESVPKETLRPDLWKPETKAA